ncbi:MAG: FG-GAP repeat protein [Myxococcales bacterium]|nr:FG-GAP repeat protein [Myxococcales bacterium]
MSRRARASIPCVLFVSSALASCRAPATFVELVVETDADPDRVFSLRACVVTAGQPLPSDPASCAQGQWTHGGPAETESFYRSFSVVPPKGDARATVDVALFADVTADATRPAVRFRRLLRFGFVRGAATRQRVFLPVRCGAASTDCTSVASAQCTVAIACEDRGETCGDEGECRPRDVEPVPLPPDAGVDVLPPRDVRALAMDVLQRRDAATDAMDAADAADDAPTDVRGADAGNSRALRHIAPRTGATVTALRPTFRWTAAPATTYSVQVCLDRECSMVSIESTMVTGDRWTPPSSLAQGRLFWRVIPWTGGMRETNAATFPTPFFVRNGGCAEVPAFDFDNDGRADVSIASHPGRATQGYALITLGRTPPMNSMDRIEVGPDPDGHLGESVLGLDYNNDGASDWLLTVPGYNTGRGAWVLRPGYRGVGPMASGSNIGVGAPMASRVGTSGAPLGDIDADGLADFAVGGVSPWDSVMVASADANGRGASPRLIIAPAAASFGSSIASYCDVDGDGRNDLVVGAPSADRVFVFRAATLSGTTWPVSTALAPATTGVRFGAAVACADLDNDGRTDVIVGAPADSANRGSVFVYMAQAGGTFSTPIGTTGPVAGDQLGGALFAGRDFDGNGTCDWIAGAHTGDSAGLVNNGKIILYHLSDGGITIRSSISGTIAGEQCGRSVSSPGDVDGDGRADVIMGCDLSSRGGANAGRATLHSVDAMGVLSVARVEWVGMPSDTLGGSLLR